MKFTKHDLINTTRLIRQDTLHLTRHLMRLHHNLLISDQALV